ncbi:MAG: ABC transporter permease [Acidobacteriota bacterium]
MIATLVHVSWLNLRHDRVALVLTFVLPLVFFSIFSLVFGAMDHERLRPIATVLAVEDDHPVSTQLADLLREDPGLAIQELEGADGAREEARLRVAAGRAAIAIVLPPGFGESLAEGAETNDGAGGGASGVAIELLSDRSNPVAAGVASGLVQAAALRLGADTVAAEGIDGVLAPQDERSAAGPLAVEVVDVLGGDNKKPSVAFFAAGIGVMFLLFAAAGRSAILIEEREHGVLERLMAARVSPTHLLLSRWLFLGLLGVTQLTVMFVWAWLAFGLELWTPRRLAGFAVMAVASAAVAAAFGLALASACRSRAQLHGVASVSILILSALGGSMFPSFLMPEHLEAIGRLTFNAWAVDGFQQVFWYEAGVHQLWPQVAVLLGFSVAFLAAARWFASGWRGLQA